MGPIPLQHVELWKPKGRGPFPVVLMLHGGCWQNDVAGATIMHALAADLVAHGIAVWNVEYRGVDRAGGGYPGTFRDVAAAADLLGRDGARLGLRTDRVVTIGHSAGGHLALWLAARPRIARDSALWTAHPLPVAAAISQGGLPDLADARTAAADACGADTVDRLVGRATAAHRDVYADTSPRAMLPLGVPQRLFAGALDPISKPGFSTAYAQAAVARGDRAAAAIIPGAGHFELIAPDTPAWARQRAALLALLAG